MQEKLWVSRIFTLVNFKEDTRLNSRTTPHHCPPKYFTIFCLLLPRYIGPFSNISYNTKGTLSWLNKKHGNALETTAKTTLGLSNAQHVSRLAIKIATSARRTVLRGTGYVYVLFMSLHSASAIICVFPPNTMQATHKAQHPKKGNPLINFFAPKVVSEPDPVTGTFDPFPSFSYTGTLRPSYPLSKRRAVADSIQLPDYSITGVPASENTFRGRNKIDILDKEGQDAMRTVCRLGREVLDIAAAAVKPGVTTDYIDEIVHKACMERNVGI